MVLSCSCRKAASFNKAFKRDSCRVAFFVSDEFYGEGRLRKVDLGGIHPLTRRYPIEILIRNQLIRVKNLTRFCP
ncbi:hypothetical protein Sbal183_4157 [Shewanella baltica OS183]|nr:hypothetical protein Sbal175_0162 [Shewanella baltica BA175]EHQ17022.1 hypothetical protein Sbal183_4157 [Shewanella baltica OS183]